MLAVMVMAFAPAFKLWAHLPPEVSVSMIAIEAEVNDESPIFVEVVYTNNAEYPIQILKNGTAAEGVVRGDFLDISFEGVRKPYLGPILTRMPPTQADYLVLQSGESQSFVVQIDDVYDLSAMGDYSISYRWNGTRSILRKTTEPINLKINTHRRAFKQVPVFRLCDADRRPILNSALGHAESIANIARTELRNAPVGQRAQAERYNEWFGAYSAARWNRVQTNFDKIFNAASASVMTFSCSCTAGTSNTIAYVYPNRPYEIFICPLFWSRQTAGGSTSKAGIIIHEISHFYVVADTDDHVYGVTASRILADSVPDRAVTNADNYMYFAENPFNQTMPGGGGGNPSNPGPEPFPEPEPEPEPEPNFSFIITIFNLLLGSD